MFVHLKYLNFSIIHLSHPVIEGYLQNILHLQTQFLFSSIGWQGYSGNIK